MRKHMSLLLIGLVVSVIACGTAGASPRPYEVVVHPGLIDNTIKMFKARAFWGAERHEQQLSVPRLVVAVASQNWVEQTANVPVKVKKELFYRAIVPMILIANEKILADRGELLTIADKISSGQALTEGDQDFLGQMKERYKVEMDDLNSALEVLLHRVDTIPPALALGQSAYESGYGTSRFAREGNALFGQWTFGGEGMKPEQHRASKGDYGVASFLWPLDSVKSYMDNLNTHKAYKELRDTRAKLRKEGKAVAGLDLVASLKSYSEKGQEYVDTLRAIIEHNNLSVADKLSLRDEPFTLAVGVGSDEEVADVEAKIEEARQSGELDQIVKGMGLQVSDR